MSGCTFFRSDPDPVISRRFDPGQFQLDPQTWFLLQGYFIFFPSGVYHGCFIPYGFLINCVNFVKNVRSHDWSGHIPWIDQITCFTLYISDF